MTVIRRCPICGSKPKYYPPDATSKCWYECTHPNLVRSINETFTLKSNYFPTREESLKDWNMRVIGMLQGMLTYHLPFRRLMAKYPEKRDDIMNG